ncbi:MAG: tetratricopeptide repeat protein [Pseudomarimonas sp.]
MRLAVATSMGLTLLLAGCAAAPTRPQVALAAAPAPIPVRSELFGEPVALPDAEQVLDLSAEQQQHFLNYFLDPANALHKPHERIYEYLDRRLSDFRYHGDTLTPTEALAGGQGNCLSLALLTTALARLAGVEVGYQRARSAPVFERREGLVTVAEHVRTRLYDPTFVDEPGFLVTQRPHIVIDYFPTRGQRSGGRVEAAELMSMFYVNLAAEALVQGDHRRSYWLLLTALEHDADNPSAFNSLAVLHRRMGAVDAAEAIYRHALARHGDNLSLLGNLRSLLRDQRRWLDAQAIDARLALLPNHDPYRYIEMGGTAIAEGKPRLALSYYAQAAEMAPYLHEAYWRMAVAYDALGQPANAASLLQQAQDNAPRDRDQHLYQAKLRSLESSQPPR